MTTADDRRAAHASKIGGVFAAAFEDQQLLDPVLWSDDELAAALFTPIADTVDAAGRAAYRDFDADAASPYVAVSASNIAGRVNTATRSMIEQDPDVDPFKPSRAAMLGLSVATAFSGFGVQAAGGQSGAKTKTWIVVSARSRHPELAGETVNLDDVFSSGQRWPGDGGDPDAVAGCLCLLTIGDPA